jgi:S1-C subfamily serine protease
MWVTIGSGDGQGLSVKVEGERFLVGTGAECQLMLGDPKAAPLHAYFEVGEGGHVALHDLGSESGTYVDGERIDGSRIIEGGEEIRIGDAVLVPSVADPAEEAESVSEHAAEPLTVAREHRQLRERVRLATALAAGAAVLALAGLVVFLATRGGGKPSPEKIVADAKKATVLVEARIPGGTSGGTGFVLDAGSGLVVTNFHVVNGGTRFAVGVDGNLRAATIAGAAPCDDLAVLRVADHGGMESFPLGSQKDLKQGEQVVAVGYPASASLSDDLTSTAGVVSRVQSSFQAPAPDAPSYPNVVQTDAALNPGNSGGPLIDERERLVGVNTATLTSIGKSPIQGQGYAIGVDRVKEVVATLRAGRSQGWAGFGLDFRPGGMVAVPMGEGAPVSGLVSQINGARIGGTFAGYCDAVRSISSGQTAVLTVQTRPGAAARQLSVRFL